MAYFADRYDRVRFPIATADKKGLRRGQLGALHAIASHFVLKRDPALVTMPTGSGKSAVLMLSAFLLRARRVLVLTPSRLVRGQIADEFSTLATLKGMGALEGVTDPPIVKEIAKRVTNPEAWQEFFLKDVVVSTPSCVSPAIQGIPEPPPTLFDLLLVDEAHHSSANTWNEVIAAFPGALKLLVTATPFRADRREIKANLIYVYPTRDAFADKVFGPIEYHPVKPDESTDPDAAVAQRAAEALKSDRAAGFSHYLMVRTDGRARADQLAKVYEPTGLRLRVVHSRHSPRVIKKTIDALKAKELDGIICVDMLGEGFDFPNLKIAAIHSPHRSLAITLQFIGRFARTNAPDIGAAKFLAIPSEIEIEAERIYKEGSEWQEIIPKLLEVRITQEEKTRERLAQFHVEESDSDESQDLSLYALRPFWHVRIYRVEDGVDFEQGLNLPRAMRIVHRSQTDDHDALIVITREQSAPDWVDIPIFEQVEHHIFLLYYHEASKFLFITASRRTTTLYDRIAAAVSLGDPSPLDLDTVNRALRDLKDTVMYQVGMRVLGLARNASYITKTGPRASDDIGTSDGRRFGQGHCMATGVDDGEKVTIGLSSGSKVWSHRRTQIPELLEWLDALAQKLVSDAKVDTGSGWDRLPGARIVSKLPEGAFAAAWQDVFAKGDVVLLGQDGSSSFEIPLVDVSVDVDRAASTADSVAIVIESGGRAWRYAFSLTADSLFTPTGGGTAEPLVRYDGLEAPLGEYLSSEPPYIYFSDLSVIEGRQLTRPRVDVPPLDMDQLRVIDWDAEKVDIQVERGTSPKGLATIHDFIGAQLKKTPDAVVVYDDGPHEIADFVEVVARSDSIYVTLYHCKKSSDPTAGTRVDDLYDVLGQSVKSTAWIYVRERLLRRLKDRGNPCINGDVSKLEALLSARLTPDYYDVVAVQPGLSKSKLQKSGTDPRVLNLLAAAGEYITGSGQSKTFTMFVSA